MINRCECVAVEHWRALNDSFSRLSRRWLMFNDRQELPVITASKSTSTIELRLPQHLTLELTTLAMKNPKVLI